MTAETGSRDIWAARLEVVGELASLINTTFDLDEIFRTAILKIRRVLEFRRASVVLVSEDRAAYHLHTLFDTARGGFVEEEATFPIDRGLTGQVISTGEATRVDAFSGTEGIRTSGERNVSALIVPIHLDNEVIGTLNFGAPESDRYEDQDLELAVLLARQIATSLHYSKLLATIDQQHEALLVQHANTESERRRLVALIDASDAAVMMVSGGRVAHANRAMGALVGLPKEIIVGAPLDDINQVLARSVVDPEALNAQVAALRGEGGPLRDRVEFAFPRRLVCQRTVLAVEGADGDVLGHLVIYRDVTKEAEAEAAKSEFVSVVSHELRTPLTSIKTSLSLLGKGAAGAVSEKMQDLLEIALRNLDRLIRLVDDLLDLSRIESGRVAMEIRAVSLDDAARRAVEAVRAFAHEREVSIEVSEEAPAVQVRADTDRLQQIVVNLVSNAVKFSPAGGRVGLRWWSENGFVVLEVADEGPGIPADQLETIFDKFRQLERSATRQHGGAGLGLAISRTLVDQMGGALWAESEEGKGSRFQVRLPLAEREPALSDAVAAETAQERSVVLVERDPDLRRLVQAQFEGEGWTVWSCARGDEALEMAAREGVALVVAGLELEDMHGLEFVKQLRRAPGSVAVPALLVGPTGDAKQAVAYGADAWVAGDPDELLAAAERLAAAPRRRLILLIEDDPAIRTGLARGLRRAGYACLESASAERALEMARARAPDLLITDLQIPGMDGLELLRQFRADPALAATPALVVTGHATPEAVKTIKLLNAHFLPKPFGTTNILRETERLIGAAAASA